MAITYPLALPAAFKAAHVTLRAGSIVGESTSPFTLQSQTYVHQGQRWEAEIRLPPLQIDDGEDMAAFLLSLNGKEGTFLMGDPARPSPRGTATGAPVVDGAAQTGQTLAIRGATVSVTGWLKAGDWLQLGSGSGAHLHKVLADANSDGAGKVTLDIWPRLRASPADGAIVTLSNAVGLWRLSANISEWDIAPARIYGMTLACREAI